MPIYMWIVVCQCVNSGRLNLWWGKVKARKWVGSPVAALSSVAAATTTTTIITVIATVISITSIVPSPSLPFCIRGSQSQVLQERTQAILAVDYNRIKIAIHQHWWRKLENYPSCPIRPWSCIQAVPSFTSSILGKLLTIVSIYEEPKCVCSSWMYVVCLQNGV